MTTVLEMESTALRLTSDELHVLRRLVKSNKDLSTSTGADGLSFHFYEASDGRLVRSISVDSQGKVYSTSRWVQSREEMYKELGL